MDFSYLKWCGRFGRRSKKSMDINGRIRRYPVWSGLGSSWSRHSISIGFHRPRSWWLHLHLYGSVGGTSPVKSGCWPMLAISINQSISFFSSMTICLLITKYLHISNDVDIDDSVSILSWVAELIDISCIIPASPGRWDAWEGRAALLGRRVPWSIRAGGLRICQNLWSSVSGRCWWNHGLLGLNRMLMG